jgi:hypothetical protein
MALPKLVIILKARGQMIYDSRDPKHTPIMMPTPPNVRYASCSNFGVCAYGQPDDERFHEICTTEPMDEALYLLADDYEDFYKHAMSDIAGYPEFKYQKDHFWTEKELRYDKFLRFYSRENAKDGMIWGLFVYRDGVKINLDRFISKTERIRLSTLIQQIRSVYPDSPMEIYDPGCLKLLSDTEIRSNGVSEPDQDSRHIGGRKSRNKKRKTKRRKIL